VIVTTHNQPHRLVIVLAALRRQTIEGLEVIIGDDGSDERTRELLARLRASELSLGLKHFWHPDDGVFNESIIGREGEWLRSPLPRAERRRRRIVLEAHLRRRGTAVGAVQRHRLPTLASGQLAEERRTAEEVP
jgi:glycosyltransferase involved in cell wall biosynthesis